MSDQVKDDELIEEPAQETIPAAPEQTIQDVDPSIAQPDASEQEVPPVAVETPYSIDIKPLAGHVPEQAQSPQVDPAVQILQQQVDFQNQQMGMLIQQMNPAVTEQQAGVPAGFASWDVQAQQAWYANAQAQAQQAPPQLSMNEQLEQMLAERDAVKQAADSKAERAREVSEGMTRYNNDLPQATQSMTEVLNALPADVREKVRLAAVTAYEQANYGYKSPLNNPEAYQIDLYAPVSPPMAQLHHVEVEAFKADVGFVPKWIRDHYRANVTAIKNGGQPSSSATPQQQKPLSSPPQGDPYAPQRQGRLTDRMVEQIRAERGDA